MGTYTLENFRSELLFDLRNRSDTTAPEGLTTTRQDSFINAGYLHVTHPSVFRHREMQYMFTINLVNGTSTYVFSPDPLGSATITAIRYVTHVTAANPFAFTKLLPRDEQWFMSRSPQTGAPRQYFINANEISLTPVPGANEVGTMLGVGAWREPIPLVAGATTVLSSLWDEVILLAAVWRAQLHLGYRDLAEATKLDFVGLLNEYKDFETLHGEDQDWAVEVRTESPMETA